MRLRFLMCSENGYSMSNKIRKDPVKKFLPKWQKCLCGVFLFDYLFFIYHGRAACEENLDELFSKFIGVDAAK